MLLAMQCIMYLSLAVSWFAPQRNRRCQVDDGVIYRLSQDGCLSADQFAAQKAQAQASNHDYHFSRVSSLNTILLRRRNADTDWNEQSKSREAR